MAPAYCILLGTPRREIVLVTFEREDTNDMELLPAGHVQAGEPCDQLLTMEGSRQAEDYSNVR